MGKVAIPTISSRATAIEIQRFSRAVKMFLEEGGFSSQVASQISTALSSYTPPATDAEIDLTPPGAPSNLIAAGGFNSILLTWGTATGNVGHYEVLRNSIDDLGTAVVVSPKVGTTMWVDTPPDSRLSVVYYYWVRAVSPSDIVGPTNATAGTQGSTADEPAYLLEVLVGEITASHLYSALNTRINLIDNPSTGLVAKTAAISAQISTINAAIADLTLTADYDPAETYNDGETVKYNGGLYAANQTTTGNLPTDATYWDLIGNYAALGDAVAGLAANISSIDSRVTATEDDITAEVLERETLAAQIRGDYTGINIDLLTAGLLHSERVARATEDTALAQSITTLSATVGDNTSAIQSEASTRADADSALSQTVTTLSASAGANQSLAPSFDLWDLGSQTLEQVTDGVAGTEALRLADGSYPNSGVYVPINQGKIYRVKFWARPSVDCTGRLYFSLRQFIDELTAGPVNGGRSPYKPSGYTKTTHDNNFGAGNWGEYIFDWTDVDWQTGVKLFLPEFLDNYGGTVGYWEIQGLKVEDISSIENSKNEALAAVQVEELARVDSDNAEALARQQLSAQLDEDIVAVEQSVSAVASGVDGLLAQIVAKIDNNGFFAGFGLASETIGGVPFSEFLVQADRFAIINPAATVLTITSMSRLSSVVTVLTSAAHGLAVDDFIVNTGAAQRDYNGSHKVTEVVSATQFRFILATTPATPATVQSGFPGLRCAKAAMPFTVQDGKVIMSNAMAVNLTAENFVGKKIVADELSTALATAYQQVVGWLLTSADDSVSLDMVNKILHMEDLTTGDYARMTPGELEFYRNGVVYKAVRRIETGVVDSGDDFWFSPPFKTAPFIMVAPKSQPSFDVTYDTSNQRLEYDDEQFSTGGYDGRDGFTAVAQLVLGGVGSIGYDMNTYLTVNNQSTTFNLSQSNVSKVGIRMDINGEGGSGHWAYGGTFTLSYRLYGSSDPYTVDGTAFYDSYATDRYYNIDFPSVNRWQVKIDFVPNSISWESGDSGDSGTEYGSATIDYRTEYLGNAVVAAEGELKFIAIGS